MFSTRQECLERGVGTLSAVHEHFREMPDKNADIDNTMDILADACHLFRCDKVAMHRIRATLCAILNRDLPESGRFHYIDDNGYVDSPYKMTGADREMAMSIVKLAS